MSSGPGKAVYDEEWISNGAIFLVNRIPLREGEAGDRRRRYVSGHERDPEAGGGTRRGPEIHGCPAPGTPRTPQPAPGHRRPAPAQTLPGGRALYRQHRFPETGHGRFSAPADPHDGRFRVCSCRNWIRPKRRGSGWPSPPTARCRNCRRAPTGAIITILGNLIENAVEVPCGRGDAGGTHRGFPARGGRSDGSAGPGQRQRLPRRTSGNGYSRRDLPPRRPPRTWAWAFTWCDPPRNSYHGICEVILDGGVTFRVTLPL